MNTTEAEKNAPTLIFFDELDDMWFTRAVGYPCLMDWYVRSHVG